MNFSYSKDGITVAAIIDTSHPKQNGYYPVRIRVTYARQRRYYSTGKDLTPDEWEALPTTKVRTLISTRKDIENSYNIVRDMVEDLAMSGAFSFDNLNKRLKRGGGVTLNAAFRAKIDDLRKQERVGSMLAYNVVLQGVERFAGNHVSMAAMSIDWVRRYESFLLGEGKSRTTIGIHMRHLRAILNDACRCGILKEAQYPFGRGRYKIQAGEG